MQPTLLATALFACSLAGCAVGPDYVQPDVATPEHFQSQSAMENRKAAVDADIVTWWAGFADPQLTRFVTLALEQNLDVAQASARVLQARASVSAATAALLPAASVSGQATRAFQSLETPQGQLLNATPDFDRYGNLYEANLAGSWEVDLFGSLRRERRAALAGYQASEAGAIATRLAVAAQSADIYISIRGLQTRVDVAREQVKKQQELVRMLNLLHEKGLAAKRQVQQAEGTLTQVQASIPALEAGLQVAMNAMDIMLGALPGTYKEELSTTGIIPIAPGIASNASPAELLRRRPDLIIAERRLAAANERIGAAIGEYYPKLSLSGLVGSATSVSGDNVFSNSASQSAGVLGLRWRLFDFGRINAQINAAKAEESELLSAYRLAVLKATEDVENAFSTLVKSEEQVAWLAHSVDALRAARQASFAAYEGGIVSVIQVLHTDSELLRAADAQAMAQTASAHAAVSAFKALGGGWQPAEQVAATLK